MKIAVIQFPGSNCHRETKLALARAGLTGIDFLWNEPHAMLHQFDGYVIVGGFSYEDRGRSGLIASLDPIMQAIADEADKGKPVLGICNGAQILVETGLVPGLTQQQKAMALTTNKRIKNNRVIGTGFYNEWITIKPHRVDYNNAFTRAFTENQVIRIPVAHAEGRFLLSETLYQSLNDSQAALFDYCDANGHVSEEFPVNPNGSAYNLAAVGNAAGNIMAMMPHPERTCAGDAVFLSMRDYLERNTYQPHSLKIDPPKIQLQTEVIDAPLELIVELTIHDNEAISLNNALRQVGFDCQLRRFDHWSIHAKHLTQELKEQLFNSYELFNPQKQRLVPPDELKNKTLIRVKEKTDIRGQQKCHSLIHHFNCAITGVTHSVLWHIEADAYTIKKIVAQNILANPTAHDCYDYRPT